MRLCFRRMIFFLVFQAVFFPCSSEKFCEEKLNNCTAEMQPVVNESRYMFPTTHMEIDGMCKIWSHIMDCIRKYMADCSTEDQKAKFNEAVSDSVDSVHAICSSDRYRRDYLENAHCLKKVSMDNCGVYFKKMVDSAYNAMSLESHICCAYSRYEKCASEPIQRMCGPHTLHMLDHSMSSLKSRCDVITQKMKANGQSCQTSDAPPMVNAIAASHKSPRIAAQTYGSLSTSAYHLISNPHLLTTPAWTQRTVIYPLPVTRHSSRILRNRSPRISPPFSAFVMVFLMTMSLEMLANEMK